MTKADLKKVALSFPGAIESTSYGSPAFKIEKKFFTRLRSEDDSLVWIVDSIDERDSLLEMDPKTYFITDHYKNYPSVLVRISAIDKTMLRRILERRWQAVAPKKLLKAVEEAAAISAPKTKNAKKRK
ncbi:MAG: MmcQ/YjbR family DNA-binding protein [Alphaproteobacteria bacterium]|nr:MmcQ/YjbR family DNA-binding protein [Alphaproteobacteria bacterium]MBL7099650.1 MmcQ/YjbR family DNA-binding protein [Alphaproteobacteria bacterium]